MWKSACESVGRNLSDFEDEPLLLTQLQHGKQQGAGQNEDLTVLDQVYCLALLALLSEEKVQMGCHKALVAVNRVLYRKNNRT